MRKVLNSVGLLLLPLVAVLAIGASLGQDSFFTRYLFTAYNTVHVYHAVGNKTLSLGIDSTGTVSTHSATFAGIGSFNATALSDTLSLAGADTTDVFVVTGYTAGSVAMDSVTYSVQPIWNHVIVTRKLINGGAFVSGAQYSYIRIAQ